MAGRGVASPAWILWACRRRAGAGRGSLILKAKTVSFGLTTEPSGPISCVPEVLKANG